MQPQPERSTCAFHFRPPAAQNALIRDQQVFRNQTEENCYFTKMLAENQRKKEGPFSHVVRRSNQRDSPLKVIERSFSS